MIILFVHLNKGKPMRTILALFISLILTTNLFAGNPALYKKTIDQPLSVVYDSVYTALENNHFYVVFEANIGKNMSGFAERWGKDYNTNKLTAIRSMVFCNVAYANRVANADPDMLGLCPLSATLIEKDGKTSILFLRPTSIAANSKALPILLEVEKKVTGAMDTVFGK